MNMQEVLGLIIAGVVMFIGLVGSVLPGIPGAPVILVAAVGHKLIFKEQSVSYPGLAFILGLTVLSLVLDFLASTLGAKKMGATWRGVIGAMVGAIVGLFFSLPGLILGPVIGAFAFELIGGREWKESARAGVGAMIGFFLGALGKVICCAAMIGIFFISAVWNSGVPANGPGTIVATVSNHDFSTLAEWRLSLSASAKPLPLAMVSSHSASGSESATIPAPTLK
jgi:uncharacterized protein YqgC (DUF456 family)